jgi:2-(3-amino-3-carboxypropyl)histidine synthase
MAEKSFKDINKEYELEIDRIVRNIMQEKAKKILLQFPDGLKLYSTVIAEEIEKKLKKMNKKRKNNKIDDVEIFIWFGTCFGACDLPLDVEKLGIDLIVQFGHSKWNYIRKDIEVLE